MANGTKARPGGTPVRDWRLNTTRLLVAQLRENYDRLDAGLITEEQAKVREFAVWESARSAGADVVAMVRAAFEGEAT